MHELNFDERLFLALNFDGGAAMDAFMGVVSMESKWGLVLWLPLCAFVLYAVWRKYGWMGLATFVVCLGLAMGVADMLCGIFKHTGLLKHVWEDFPVRHRPMFDSAVRDMTHVPSYAHGPYGTVSAHAATMAAMALMTALAVRRRWYTALVVVVVLLVDYSRIYLACHFPQDLLLGTIVGLVAAAALWLLWRKLYATVMRLK